MRTPVIAGLAVAALAAVAGGWLAAGSAWSATPKDPKEVFRDECGACHWAYLPVLLPARSWRAITADLSHHFGQNASLDADTTREITAYLVAHAADAPGSNHAFTRGLRSSDTPLRITDTPMWRDIHGGIRSSVFRRSDIKTKSNCMACHSG